ncbi:hypothetical protein FACS1894200_12210 [Spirochaetia bacterium]|nr:hypothetical protein FACS1894200_12210 [Spirochaetia bacterium]
MVEYPTIPAGLRLLKIYIESGIPVYVFLKDSKKPGHAVLIIGHEDKYDHIVGPMDGKDWMDVSDFEKKVVVIDDNRPPYQIGSPEALLPYHKIISYIVPLPRHTNLDAQATFNICQEIFKDERFGLKQFGARWLTRLLLTGSHSFKMFLLKKSGLDEALKSFLVRLSMPKYVWICEIYKSEDFTREEKTSAGILILDSTGSKSISSVLFYYIDNKSILYNDNALTGTRVLKQIKKPFKMAVYKHNLKGAWNGWKL